MMVSPASHQRSKHRGPRFQFLVHLLKVTQLPSHVPSPSGGFTPRESNTRKSALKVTALYNSKQIALGDFPIVMNECVIDRKLCCQFVVSTLEIQPKLHFYIDQVYSPELTGHLALDLKEYMREGETEVYVKYPLYANTSRHSRGPVLKMIIQNLGEGYPQDCLDEDNEILILQNESIESRHSQRLYISGEPRCTSQNPASGGQNGLQGPCTDSSLCLSSSPQDSSLCHIDEARLLELEGALSDIGEKLKLLVSTFKGRDLDHTGDCIGGEVDYASHATSSPLLSSLHTGTSVDSHSEIYEEQCTDSDDVFDLSLHLGSSMYPLPRARHSRTLSDISTFNPSQRCLLLPRHSRSESTEAYSECWFSQSIAPSGDEDHDHNHDCSVDGCFMCSSSCALTSYEGIQASLSRSKSFSMPPKSIEFGGYPSASAGLPEPMDDTSVKRDKEAGARAGGKGPGLLRSLFGAVVVAGVSLLGVRNASASRGRPPQVPSAQTKVGGQPSRLVSSRDIRSERSSKHRYSFRR